MPNLHDIMRGSPGWARLGNGIPDNVAPTELRRILHDYSNSLTVIVDALNRALDAQDAAKADIVIALESARRELELAKKDASAEHARIHDRIDRRGAEHEKLKDDLFRPKTGYFPEMMTYIDKKFGKFTGPLFVLIGSVMSGLVLLAASRITGG